MKQNPVQHLEGPADPALAARDQASKENDEFIYLLSHDVRASVRALVELPQWIVEDLEEAGVTLTGSVARSIDLMNRHTARLDRMLLDLLTFSRIGRMQEICDVDLGAVVTQAIAESGAPPGCRFTTRLAHTSVMIGDRDMATLVSALIGNAVKHGVDAVGEITVESHLSNDILHFGVSDAGPGIPAQYRERVFGAMTTLQPRDAVEGSGMGLAICQRIVTQYGGTISLTSASGESGLKVEVCLPLRPLD